MKTLIRLGKFLAKTVGVIVLTLLLFIVVFLAAFFVVPELSIKSDRLAKLVEKFAPEDIQIKWQDANLRAIKSGLFGKDVVLELNGVCVQYKKEAIDACFDRLFWGVGFSVSDFNPRITRFVPLIATGGVVKGNLDLLAEKEPKPEEPGGFDIIEFARETLLPKWQWNGSIAELRSVDLKTGPRRLQGAFLLETQGSWNQSPLSRRADELKVSVGKRDVKEQFLRLSVINFYLPGVVRANSQMHVVIPQEDQERVWNVLFKGDAELTDGKRILVSSKNKVHSWQDVDFDIDAILKNVTFAREAQLKGKYTEDQVDGVFSAKVGGFTSQVKTLDFVACGFGLALEQKEANIRCGPQTVTLGLQERPSFRNKTLFRLYPTFDLKISNFSYERGVEADWKLDLDLNHMNFLALALSGTGSFASLDKTDTDPGGLFYSADAKLDLNIAEFKKVTNLLRRTPFAIPAPVNDMGGKLDFTASGFINEEGGEIPFELITRLQSASQKLATTLKGDFTLEKNAKGSLSPALNLNLALEDVRLSLPRIDVTGGFPSILPDNRFQKGLSQVKPPSEPKEESPMRMNIYVATKTPAALKINTNLTGAPLPITLRYAIRPLPGGESPRLQPAGFASPDSETEKSKTQSAGHIYVGKTPIDLSNANIRLLRKLQRDAVIDYVDLKLEPDGTQRIEGRLLVKNPGGVIKVVFLGTVDRPVIRLESDPPVEENQILAALLFGRPLDQIDQEQAQSAAQAKTALNDTALTLVQMFLLANTPVDSLNYDSDSGRVVASVGVGQGTSLELGGASGAGTEVGLRRRLARNLYLNTYVESTSQSSERLVSAFVEWVRRF